MHARVFALEKRHSFGCATVNTRGGFSPFESSGKCHLSKDVLMVGISSFSQNIFQSVELLVLRGHGLWVLINVLSLGRG